MKNNETPEILLDKVFQSAKVRKLAIMFVLAGIIIFIISLLPPVQNAFFSFVDAHVSRRGTGGSFESRLRSLLSLPFFGLVVFILAFCSLFSKNIALFFENNKNICLIITITIGVGILLLVYVCVFSYQHGWQWLDSDNSSEMVLGKLLADENTFVSRNWHYSTEIILIYQTIFSMPLFKLIGHYENWALIRAFTIFLNNLVLILSYIFMAKQIKIQTKWICITSLFLFLPISTEYWGLVTFSGFYIFIFAQLFCCLGLFIRLAGSSTTKKVLVDFILFTALSFVLGVQGIRYLLIVHIPLLITCVYFYSKMAQKKKFTLFLGCYGFVVCCAGFVINYLLHFWYSFHSFESMCLVDLYTEFFPKLGQSLASLAGFFGLSTGSSLLSARGIFSVIAIIGTFILFWAVIKSFRQQTEYQFIPVFFIIFVIFNLFIFIVVDEKITSRYFVFFMVFYIPLIAILFEYAEKFYGTLKRTALVFGIVLFIFGKTYLNIQDMAGLNKNSVRTGYIQYLFDTKLDYGFASYWNANVTTELTNGKIELAGLKIDGSDPDKSVQFHISNWLIPVKFYNPSFHQGESFLLLTRAEWELAQRAERPFARLVPDYEDNDFIIIRYPSAEIIHREVLDK